MLGILLLQDDTGSVVDAIVDEYQDGERITLKIFQLWINGAGQQPVSWATLVQVLHDVNLNELAKEINKFYNT